MRSHSTDSSLVPNSSLSRLLAVLLLAGVALLSAGAAIHPVLVNDGARDLELIAGSEHFRALHLAMLAGSGLIIAGIWIRALPPRRSSMAVLAVLGVLALGLAINGLNIAYMAGSGAHLAEMFRSGRADALTLFEVTHPIGLMYARFGNFVVAIGALALGFVEREDDESPSWLAWLAWLTAAGGLFGVFFFHESSRMALAAVSLLCVWAVATAALTLRGAPAPAGPMLEGRPAA
jgi:hypothetical protein